MSAKGRISRSDHESRKEVPTGRWRDPLPHATHPGVEQCQKRRFTVGLAQYTFCQPHVAPFISPVVGDKERKPSPAVVPSVIGSKSLIDHTLDGRCFDQYQRTTRGVIFFLFSAPVSTCLSVAVSFLNRLGRHHSQEDSTSRDIIICNSAPIASHGITACRGVPACFPLGFCLHLEAPLINDLHGIHQAIWRNDSFLLSGVDTAEARMRVLHFLSYSCASMYIKPQSPLFGRDSLRQAGKRNNSSTEYLNLR